MLPNATRFESRSDNVNKFCQRRRNGGNVGGESGGARGATTAAASTAAHRHQVRSRAAATASSEPIPTVRLGAGRRTSSSAGRRFAGHQLTWLLSLLGLIGRTDVAGWPECSLTGRRRGVTEWGRPSASSVDRVSGPSHVRCELIDGPALSVALACTAKTRSSRTPVSAPRRPRVFPANHPDWVIDRSSARPASCWQDLGPATSGAAPISRAAGRSMLPDRMGQTRSQQRGSEQRVRRDHLRCGFGGVDGRGNARGR